MGRVAAVALLSVLGNALCAPLPAQSRSLDWPSFIVHASLDSTGRLSVVERQTMRFTGEWNGGERRFDLSSGQKLVFSRLRRIDSVRGDTVELTEGDLSEVDQYRWFESNLLRWRSRLPIDPPFRDTEFVYLLEFSYENILVPDGDAYLLDHQFAFRERDGMISNFSLTLDLHDAWRAPADARRAWQVESLPPGESFLVTIPLSYAGTGAPSGVWFGTSATLRYGFAAVLLGALGTMLLQFFRVEASVDRFGASVSDEAITREWLEANLLTMVPEVSGAAWDDRVGAPEVAATLARMVGEEKLSSRVETTGWKRFPSHVLHLTRNVSLESLAGYELKLVNALFTGGRKTTNTTTIRKRYAKQGFNPASILEVPLSNAVEAIPNAGREVKLKGLWRITARLLLLALPCVALSVWRRLDDTPVIMMAALLGAFLYAFAIMQASFWRRRVVRVLPHALRMLLPLAAIWLLYLWLLWDNRFRMGPFAFSALMLIVLGMSCSVLNAARSRYTAERMRFRRTLASARGYFRRELKRASPRIEDRWYPYLLAFGLGRHVDKWFRAYGTETVTSVGTQSGTSFGSASSDGGGWGGFSGGGGFAGGGATVAFGAAVGGMAASIAAPSSSGSSSGGGGSSSSGGSSGGGGGGGW